MKLNQIKVRQKGFVLIVVLCMVILLGVILFGFNHTSRTNLHCIDRFRGSVWALNCARAGLNIAVAIVRDTSDVYMNRMLPSLCSDGETFEVCGKDCSLKIIEESGKLNVNLLKDENGKLNRTRIDQLLRLIDLLNRDSAGSSYISYGLVPSIIDWIDGDNEVTSLPFVKRENSGAESGYYEQLSSPYKCRNCPLDTIEELLLVKTMTPQAFESISEFVTVYGDGSININCASKQVIECLSEKMDAALAQIIIDRRKIKPFDDITELREVPGMTDSIYNAIKQTVTIGPEERYYSVTSQGNVDDVSYTIEATLRRNTETKKVEIILYRERQA
jgi:general secretion pathway protein K